MKKTIVKIIGAALVSLAVATTFVGCGSKVDKVVSLQKKAAELAAKGDYEGAAKAEEEAGEITSTLSEKEAAELAGKLSGLSF